MESRMDVTLNRPLERTPLSRVGYSNGDATPVRALPQLRVGLLGGFRVERVGAGRPVTDWQRRTAKTLTKLLATDPRHALHREQILDMLWPDVGVESALNSFGKALYAARRALEPELLPRQGSTYLRLTDYMVALDTRHVLIDADHFQLLAEAAIRQRDEAAFELALEAYGGELLPEDRYEDWCAERRDFLAELHIRLLLGMSERLEERGAYGAAANRLREVLQHDPTREQAHRRLMVLYAGAGARDRAVRQFHACQDVLWRKLDLAPEEATVALYRDVVANRIQRRSATLEGDRGTGATLEGDRGTRPTPEGDPETIESPHPRTTEQGVETPFVGRQSLLRQLSEQLARADEGTGRMVLVSGEAGVGKTRLVAELATEARRRGAAVLWSGSGAHANPVAYGPFAVALDGYLASRPEDERDELARRYPALAPLMPSLGMGKPRPLAERPADDHLSVVPAIVGLLTDLARARTVVLVLGDLHDLHRSSLDLLEYLAQLSVQRRWLIVGTFREEGVEVGGELWRMIAATFRERLCLHVELQRLARPDADELVRAILRGGEVGDAVLDRIYARSLGNPLFVEELVRDMRERSELVRPNGSWHIAASLSACVPGRVRAQVALRVAPMDPTVRRVLALAAVGGGTDLSLNDFRRAGAALQPPLSEAALFDALDRALESRILEERNDVYAFRHPLVCSALYEDLPKHRRDQLHAALSRSREESRLRARAG
jgi:DNA-binding SARP family transcriptional activator